MVEQRWDYKVLDVETDFTRFDGSMKADRLTETLNRKGAQGRKRVNAIHCSLSGLSQIKLFLKHQR